MRYSTHAPAAPLNDFVDYFWLVEKGSAPRKELILPSGTVELVVNLREDQIRIHDPARLEEYERFSGALISGTYSAPFACDGAQHEAMFGVHFKPGGAFPFLGASACALANAHADLADLWGRQAAELRERLCRAATPRERFRTAEAHLTARLRLGVARHSAVTAALGLFGEEGGALSVRDAAARVGFSQRHFIELFTAQVGLSPKLFCRLQRFQRALTLARRTVHETTWADVAAECGYFDQSHLIRDFQDFSRMAPTLFRRGLSADLIKNHLALPA